MGMWTDEAKRAAEQEYGRRNYRWLALGRSLPAIAGVVALVGLVLLVRFVADAWQPEWTARLPLVAGSIAALAVVALLIRRRVRRPYRMPRRWFRRRY